MNTTLDAGRRTTRVDALKNRISDHLTYTLARDRATATDRDLYFSTAWTVRDRLGGEGGLPPGALPPEGRQARLLPLPRVPDGAHAGQRAAQPGAAGRHRRGAGGAGDHAAGDG